MQTSISKYVLAAQILWCSMGAFKGICQQGTLPRGREKITLTEAVKRAQNANSAYATAVTASGAAQSLRTVARAAVLPNVGYHNQYFYTQGNGEGIRFIANNSVHEYVSQGVVTESIGGVGISSYKRATADAAAARARVEVARRGLVVTVVSAYYGVLAADAKLTVAREALDEAQRFRENTRLRESGGEVSHSDYVRADLQAQQRERELADANVLAARTRIDLGVFLYDDPTTQFDVDASINDLPPLPSRTQIETEAKNNNPDLRAAIEGLRAANYDVIASRFGYLPDLTLNYTYGIDAPNFAVNTPDGLRNLGYSASATLDIPIWDWFSNRSKIRQSVIARDQAKIELTIAQRQLLATLSQAYTEAEVSRSQVDSLNRSVLSATDSLRLSNLRYNSGEGTILEVVDSQTLLVTAEGSKVDGTIRYITALAALQTLTGTMP